MHWELAVFLWCHPLFAACEAHLQKVPAASAWLPLATCAYIAPNVERSNGIRCTALGHDILDFYARELLTFGRDRERTWNHR